LPLISRRPVYELASAAVEHKFTGPAYTIGIEEELMILDAKSFDLANEIEAMLESAPAGEIKPELMESVLEISTEPCETTTTAADQLGALRRQVSQTAASKDLAIGSAGTHPFARWENQRIAARARYRDLVAALRYVARRELIFGMHVHVGVDDPDKAIHVANGMRLHIPVLLALSANSPFWQGNLTGFASTRQPIFRAFPRVGIPPSYRDWNDYERRIQFMVKAGVIPDYTYLWHDVRAHPALGTVEMRAMDAQTRLEHTLGLSALVQAMVRELSEHFQSGKRLSSYPFEMLDENKWLAARHGLDGELVDLPRSDRVQTRELASRLIERMRDHCSDLGSTGYLEAVQDLLDSGNGATRQQVVYEANHDLHEVMGEIVSATAA
jgi:glutamate---cysteine ligase / carboxylate-amine ligase